MTKRILKMLPISVMFLCITIVTIKASTVRTIDINQTYSDNLSNKSEVDQFTFTISKPGEVSLDFTHENLLNPNNPHGWVFTLLNSNMDELTSYNSDYNSTKTTSCDIGLPAGTYYVKISVYGPNLLYSTYSSVSYGLKVNYTENTNWETEFNDSAATADNLPMDTTINGSLMLLTDIDYYKFSLDTDGKVSLYFTHENLLSQNNPNGWVFTLLNSNMDELASCNSDYNSTKTTSRDIGLPAGTYYVKISVYDPNLLYSTYSSVSYGLKVNYSKMNEQ
jgi:hypothetical protein